MNKEKLTMNVLFSGIGCQERGFENSNLFDVEVVSTSEINKEAVLSYAAIHCGMTQEMIDTYTEYPSREEMVRQLKGINLGYEPEKNKYYDWDKLARRKTNDIEKYWLACKLNGNLGDISKISKMPYADLWTCSFPCFIGSTLVLTKEYGYTPIKNIKEGISVLTHDNTYQAVTKSMMTGRKNIYKINAMCFDKLECTENHKFYVRTRHRVNTHIKGKAVNYRYFDKPIWKECKDLTKNDYLGYAINQNSIIPKWQDNSGVRVKLSSLMNNEDFWWIIGRYIADGYKQTSKTGDKIVICCGTPKVKLGLVEKHLNACGLNFCTDDHKSCMNYHICSNELYKFVSQFGDKAYGKFIPSFVFDMPINLCEAFFNGYWSGDGCFSNNRYKSTSISRELIYGLGQLVAKIYHRPFSIFYSKRKPTTVIEGRIVNQHDTYTIMFSKENAKQDKAFYEEGYIWFPIKEVSNIHTVEDVYDITVENNHSFTANGAIVHNCTDISVAGKMKGLSPDTSTRSSLLWENIRLLKKAKDNGTLPKYLMFENVKNLVSKKFIDDFNNLLEVLDELGFNSYWKVLNAKDCGVPQNRERVFVISIRKDIDNGAYDFPKPFDTGIRLKDVLDKEVDEKYYLSKDIQERFHITDSTFTKNIVGTTKPDFRTIGQRDLVYQQDSIMGALVATDYKQPKQIIEQIPMDKSLKNTRYGIDYSNCITAREDCGSSPHYAQQGTAVLELTNNCIQVGNLNHYNYDEMNRVYSKEGCSPTLNTMQGGDRQPRVLEPIATVTEATKKGYAEIYEGDSVNLEQPNSKTRRGRVGKQVAQTLTTSCNQGIVEPTVQNFRVRKLTPNECWKLMGLTEEDCANAKNIGVADSQLYKQAGNGIVTNCVEQLAEHLYKAQYDNTYKCTDENFI